MNLTTIFRLFNKNWVTLVMCSFLFSVIMFFYSAGLPKEYRSESILYTGIESGVGNMIGSGFGVAGPVGNQYANLITEIEAKSTLEETGMRLLALHLLEHKVSPKLLTSASFSALDEMVPPSLRKDLIVQGNAEETYNNIKAFRQSEFGSQRNRSLFENATSPYSYQALRDINVIRMATSDFIRLEYTWTDPGIAQSTLDILNSVVISRMSSLKAGQTNDVVMYFRKRVEEALVELKRAEEQLEAFKLKHDVINYDQQARSITMHNDNMENDYLNEKSKNNSLRRSKEKLEEQLEINKKIFKSSDEILSLRTDIAVARAKLAELDIYFRDRKKKQALQLEKEKLEAALEKEVMRRWSYGRTTEGIGIERVLQEWLQHSLDLEESNSRISDYESRKKYYQKEFDRLASLGTEIEKQSRNIKIKEANYLEMLDALNAALINQKSENMAMGNWMVTMEPTFPLDPIHSKKMVLILSALISGFFIPFGIILLMNYLDQSLRTPQRSKELTGLNLLGAYPNMDLYLQAEKEGVDLKNISALSVGLLCQNFLLEARKASWSADEPLLIAVISTEPGEGKGRMTHKMANELAMRGFNVLAVNYKSFEADGIFQYDRAGYKVDRNYLNVHSPEQMLPPEKSLEDYNFVFFQFPALLHSRFPVDVMGKMQMAIMPVKANRVWSKADAQALNEVSSLFEFKPRLILNGTSYEDMEEVIGEIAKKRSAFRKWVKKALSLQLIFRKGYKGNPLF